MDGLNWLYRACFERGKQKTEVQTVSFVVTSRDGTQRVAVVEVTPDAANLPLEVALGLREGDRISMLP